MWMVSLPYVEPQPVSYLLPILYHCMYFLLRLPFLTHSEIITSLPFWECVKNCTITVESIWTYISQFLQQLNCTWWWYVAFIGMLHCNSIIQKIYTAHSSNMLARTVFPGNTGFLLTLLAVFNLYGGILKGWFLTCSAYLLSFPFISLGCTDLIVILFPTFLSSGRDIKSTTASRN